ncbi:MAG TPA: type II toxin-antitoxin system VapC family toxin [Pirellulaceae bacterium]|jgi:predicted nucleic acid-binding protein|nr:type II toxin-antitoxin system VapC family toxin [Pirellulaceae bacterium]
MSLQRVYIETSIVSYLRQRPSPQIVAAARQLLTQQWWDEGRGRYELVTSQYVIDEASCGDRTMASERLRTLEGMPLLELDPAIDQLAATILRSGALQQNAAVDALHIATASFHGVDYLLTWNLKHLANRRILPRVHATLTEAGRAIPIIRTPEEMLDDEYA